ncbi:MAG: DUF4440 domain-containing protein [Gemmatimonadales bacterium]
MTTRRSHLILSGAVLLAACAAPTIDREAEGQALMQFSRDWSARVAAGNVDSIMTGWADDAVLMAPGSPPLEGKAAIRQYVEAAMRIPGFSIRWEPVSVHVAAQGDLAYLVERNVTTVADSAGSLVTTHGKAVTVWRRTESGGWENVIDIWNDAPPPQ